MLLLVFQITFTNEIKSQDIDEHYTYEAPIEMECILDLSSASINSSGDFIEASINSSGQISRSYIKFDLSGLPLNATILSAEFQLSGYSVGEDDNTSLFYQIEDNWDFTTLQGGEYPAYSMETVSQQISSENPVNINIDFLNFINLWQNGINNNGLMFKLENEAVPRAASLKYNSTNSEIFLKPKLIIEYQTNDYLMTDWDFGNTFNISS